LTVNRSAHLNAGGKQATTASSLQDVCHLALQLGSSAPRASAAWFRSGRSDIDANEAHRSAMRSWSNEGNSSSKSSLFNKGRLSTDSNAARWHNAPSFKLRDEIHASSAHGIHRFA
jgi:hypothetical protein